MNEFLDIDLSQCTADDLIYSGSYHKSYKVGSYDGFYFLKTIKADYQAVLVEAVKILSKISHENIVRFLTASTANGYLILEYIENETLFNLLHVNLTQTYTKRDACLWALQCAEGLNYLHNMTPEPIVHGNLNSYHLLLTERRSCVKIAGFASTKKRPHWSAPEVLRGERKTVKSDVYSWAVLLWEMKMREPPFVKIRNERKLKESIASGERLSVPSFWHERVQSLLTECLLDAPEQRPAMSGVRAHMNVILDSLDQVPNLPKIPISDITFKNALGNGATGVVYKARWLDRSVAIKRFYNEVSQSYYTEALQLSQVSHPNIIEIFGTASDSEYKYIVLEHAENGSLSSLLHGNERLEYTPSDAVNWAKQCASAIAYLHGRQPRPVLHRDLKTDNMLLTNKRRTIKICDFGLVAVLKTKMSVGKGTEHYMAPEVYNGKAYTEKCDVFSWAIVMWEMLRREKPYRALHPSVVTFRVTQGDRPHLPVEWPDEVKSLIASCWHAEPSVRFDMLTLCDKLQALLDNKAALDALGNNFPVRNRVVTANVTTQRSSTASGLKLTVQFDKFKIDKLIGRGDSSTVYKALWGVRTVALKQLDTRNHLFKEAFENEVQQLAQLSHSNIVEMFATSSDGPFKYIVLEYADNGSLYDLLYGMEEKVEYSLMDALVWAKQCANGVAYLHGKKPRAVIHGNLNTDNVLLTENLRKIKICDFGLNTELTTTLRAPEVYQCKKYTEKYDVYSWAMILWEVLMNDKPYTTSDNDSKTVLAMLEGERPPVPDEWPKEIKELLKSSWHTEPNARPSMQVVEAEMANILQETMSPTLIFNSQLNSNFFF